MNLFLRKVFSGFSSLLFDKKKTNTLILLIVFLFLFLRVPILFTGIEKTFQYEELVRGTIAREIIAGPKFSLIDYQVDSYSGGGLVASIVTIPFFLFLGQNLLALKLPPLLFFTLTLILLFKLCDRFFERRIALVSCFIFIFSPPLWTIYSFVNFGFFHESVFFTLLSLFVFYEIFYENKKRLRYFVLLGVLCGFSLFFVYFTIFPLVSMLLLWFLFDKKFFLKKSFLFFLAGFLVGFSPWIYYGLLNNWPGFDVLFHGKGFRSEALGFGMLFDIVKKFFSTIFLKFPSALYFKETPFLDENSAGILYYYLLFFSSVLFLFLLKFKSFIKNFSFSAKPSKESFILLYFLVFLVSFSASNLFVADEFIWWRYFLPLFPFAFISVALVLNKIRFKRKTVVLAFVFFVLCFWFIGNIRFYETKEFGSALNEKGFSYKEFGNYLGYKIFFGENPEKIFLEAKLSDKNYNYVTFYNMQIYAIRASFSPSSNGFNEEEFNRLIKLIELVPEEFRFSFFEYSGRLFVFGLGDQNEESSIKQIELVNSFVPEEYKKDFFVGVGFQSVYSKGKVERNSYDNTPFEFLPSFFEGVGMHSLTFSQGNLDSARFERIKGQLPGFEQPDSEESFFRGVGKNLILILVQWEIMDYTDYWQQKPNERVQIVLDFFGERNEKEKKAIIEGMKQRILLVENEKTLKELINGIDSEYSQELFSALSENQKKLIQ
jgi:4-amino-4-deoxy-L-arabinose transferase-like glycosyltransferase